MTLNTLLTFLVISQVAMAAYLLYSFNTIERASRRRHEALATQVKDAMARMEARLTGSAMPRTRADVGEEGVVKGREADLLQPRQA